MVFMLKRTLRYKFIKKLNFKIGSLILNCEYIENFKKTLLSKYVGEMHRFTSKLSPVKSYLAKQLLRQLSRLVFLV